MSNLDRMLCWAMVAGLAAASQVVKSDLTGNAVEVLRGLAVCLGTVAFIAAIRFAMGAALENRAPTARQGTAQYGAYGPPPSPPQGGHKVQKWNAFPTTFS